MSRVEGEVVLHPGIVDDIHPLDCGSPGGVNPGPDVRMVDVDGPVGG